MAAKKVKKVKERRLHHRNLLRKNFNGFDLRGADFTGSDLSAADFTGANCEGAHFESCSLDSAMFKSANLRGTKFLGCDIYGPDFGGADLSNAKFVRVLGKGIDAQVANFESAEFVFSSFVDCSFMNSRFNRTSFTQTAFARCIFRRSDLADASMWETSFSKCVLSSAKGLDRIGNIRDVSIDTVTLMMGESPFPRSFLLGAGVPPILVDYLPSLTNTPIVYESCFISYSTSDIEFCRRLRRELLGLGINAWIFDEDAKWGKPMWGEIDQSIRIHDRVVVVCSERSLKSGPVLREIERALRREDAEGQDILFPIRVDDYIFNGWQHPRKDDVLSKIVGDFSEWRDYGKMRMAITRFAQSLRKAGVVSKPKLPFGELLEPLR
ncbi:MAG TPA: toll/interleukin-1 receptor domain-containing protein [Terracidiphilus sp.]|nr:toll/interleukin-1 receptor domain-containing protein [Terracidiphilus sp.]